MPHVTRDGIPIEPLYPRHSGRAPLAMRPGLAWTIVAPIDNPENAAAQVTAALARGATGLSLRFADAPLSGGIGRAPTERALRAALAAVDPASVAIRIEPHAAGADTARWLSEWIATTGLAPERARITLGLDLTLDPNAAGAVSPILRVGFRGQLLQLDGRVVHEAGGSEAQELAAILAYAAEWLRAPDSDADPLTLCGAAACVDRDVLVSLAKLRALRLVLARLAETCGSGASVPVHAETSRRMLTRFDPRGNILRNTVAAFAATAGGAESLTVLPHDAALAARDPAAAALALNLQHLLADEAEIGRFTDPAAGSGALEALTDALAEKAWVEFQQIEREGGLAASLASGAFPARIASARHALLASVETDAPLVGVTRYRSEGTPAEAAPAPHTSIPGLVPISLDPALRGTA